MEKTAGAEKWDGVIQEYAFFEFWAGLSKRVDDGRARQLLRGVLDEAIQFGMTSLQAMTADPERLVRLLQELNTPLRVRAIFFPVTEVTKVAPHPRKQVSERISYGDLKLILDGTPIERSAAMRKPYDRQYRCWCRGRTSRPAARCEYVLNSADAPHCRDALSHFATEGQEIKRAINGVRFRADTQRAPGRIRLALVHHNVLADPPGTTSPGSRSMASALHPAPANTFSHWDSQSV
jgi:hypothetical protein